MVAGRVEGIGGKRLFKAIRTNVNGMAHFRLPRTSTAAAV